MVVEDEGLLDELVVSLQCVNFGCVRYDALLVILQVGQLVLQSAVHFNGYPANFLPTQKRRIYFPVITSNVVYVFHNQHPPSHSEKSEDSLKQAGGHI